MLDLWDREERAREIFISGHLLRRARPEDRTGVDARSRGPARLDRHRDASDLYLAAIEADPSFIDAHLGGGELFTEK